MTQEEIGRRSESLDRSSLGWMAELLHITEGCPTSYRSPVELAIVRAIADFSRSDIVIGPSDTDVVDVFHLMPDDLPQHDNVHRIELDHVGYCFASEPELDAVATSCFDAGLALESRDLPGHRRIFVTRNDPPIKLELQHGDYHGEIDHTEIEFAGARHLEILVDSHDMGIYLLEEIEHRVGGRWKFCRDGLKRPPEGPFADIWIPEKVGSWVARPETGDLLTLPDSSVFERLRLIQEKIAAGQGPKYQVKTVYWGVQVGTAPTIRKR